MTPTTQTGTSNSGAPSGGRGLPPRVKVTPSPVYPEDRAAFIIGSSSTRPPPGCGSDGTIPPPRLSASPRAPPLATISELTSSTEFLTQGTHHAKRRRLLEWWGSFPYVRLVRCTRPATPPPALLGFAFALEERGLATFDRLCPGDSPTLDNLIQESETPYAHWVSTRN